MSVCLASSQQRKTLAFTILDEDDDGYITEEDFRTFVRVAMTIGWCYDVKMYKQISTWPPEFAIKDSTV
jgi:Ca2+-binding EF-hand superfamily protein